MRVFCPILSAQTNLTHGFFTREGGVSDGDFTTLNCGFGAGDLNTHVAQNRSFVARALGVEATHLCTPYQTHSAKALIIDAPWQGEPPQADALVTKTPGLAIGILTADCVPVLLYDAKRRVIAALHAGWKGAVGGIIEATVDAMKTLGATPETIIASIGPAIEQCSYEVGPEFKEQFLKESGDNEKFFEPSSRENHFMFDLKGYVNARLTRAGITHISMLAHDTCLEERLFFSYRRACQRGESAYGRQISALALAPEKRQAKGLFKRFFARYAPFAS